MPDYTIDTWEHPDGECAFCGEPNDLVKMHVRNAERGGTTWVPGCRSCNSSMRGQTLKMWLRDIRDESYSKWEDILEQQKGKRTGLARLVREIRDEPTR